MNNIDLVVLGELKEKPKYAGEIITSLRQKNLHNTMNFTLSSIYKKVLELKDKGYIEINGTLKTRSQDAIVYQITCKGEEYFNELIKSTITSNSCIDIKLNINKITVIFQYTDKTEQIKYVEDLKEKIIKAKQTLYENKEIKSKAENFIFLQEEKILLALEEWATEIGDELLVDETET